MIRSAVAFAGTAVAFGAMDAVWLTLTNAPLYRPTLAPILADQVRLVPAVIFYVIYLAGVVQFAIKPALLAKRWQRAAQLGGAFGFVAYATYDFTNQATLKVWSTTITALDLGWGVFATAVAASAGYLAVRATKF
jgi:uncharacterized membrane protein